MTEALYATTPDALRPTLVQLRDTAISKLHEAEHEANERLDSILAQSTATQVIRLPLLLSGREVSTREEVDMLLHELRERLLAQLKENTRIRLV